MGQVKRKRKEGIVEVTDLDATRQKRLIDLQAQKNTSSCLTLILHITHENWRYSDNNVCRPNEKLVVAGKLDRVSNFKETTA
jgi:hypothetical protein